MTHHYFSDPFEIDATNFELSQLSNFSYSMTNAYIGEEAAIEIWFGTQISMLEEY
jgi:hypothetical protein